MKKSNKKKVFPTPDIETLTMWKYSTTKAKLNWLESAYRFGKLKKF